jgi:hypothetical protein
MLKRISLGTCLPQLSVIRGGRGQTFYLALKVYPELVEGPALSEPVMRIPVVSLSNPVEPLLIKNGWFHSGSAAINLNFQDGLDILLEMRLSGDRPI